MIFPISMFQITSVPDIFETEEKWRAHQAQAKAYENEIDSEENKHDETIYSKLKFNNKLQDAYEEVSKMRLKRQAHVEWSHGDKTSDSPTSPLPDRLNGDFTAEVCILTIFYII